MSHRHIPLDMNTIARSLQSLPCETLQLHSTGYIEQFCIYYAFTLVACYWEKQKR